MADLKNFHLFQQGAEARIYTGQFLGQPAIAKKRFSKKYRHPDLDNSITRDRHRAEARALLKSKQLGISVPTVYFCDNDTNTIVMEHMENANTARDVINSLLKDRDENGLDILAKLIGETIGKLHKGGVIHGDITTSNILVTSVNQLNIQLCLIDFGLSFQEGSPEDKGVDLYVLERALLSSHPNSHSFFTTILTAYANFTGKQAGEIARKFEEIRLRGRKRTMLG